MQKIQSLKKRFGIIGHSVRLNETIEKATLVAPTLMSVLITGESGSGKESFSKIIHHLSPHKHGKLIAVNCGAIPEGTIDSELFGHVKGAFTGAEELRRGYFEEVDKGTIFLDEIAEMPLGTQARLLRVLEQGEYMRVGSSKVHRVDVRIIAATHVNLSEAVAKGKFRKDLYYRLSTLSIHLPSLQERKEDIKPLFRKFALDFADTYHRVPIKLMPEAWSELENYSFPGNVRQLKNIVAQLSVMERGEEPLTKEQLHAYLPKEKPLFPAIVPNQSGVPGGEAVAFSLQEREMLYNILVSMRKELNELKAKWGQYGHAVKHAAVHEYQDAPSSQKEHWVAPAEEVLSLQAQEKKLIQKALKLESNKRKAAHSLGIAERTLYRKIKEYELE